MSNPNHYMRRPKIKKNQNRKRKNRALSYQTPLLALEKMIPTTPLLHTMHINPNEQPTSASNEEELKTAATNTPIRHSRTLIQNKDEDGKANSYLPRYHRMQRRRATADASGHQRRHGTAKTKGKREEQRAQSAAMEIRRACELQH
uniref:Uncharacterized protein n=1 Tax=Physcomitrium patens TaxID=3218 RepID=A0A2K1J381_PHYPA|nr:hypothetical protein PHYPA_021837 [Physcomitrium patens]